MIRAPARLAMGAAAAICLAAPHAVLAGAGTQAPIFHSASSAVEVSGGAITFGRALDIEGTPLRLAVPRREMQPGFLQSAYRGPPARPAGLPLRASAISSNYGMRFHPLMGGQRFHAGLDFAAAAGTPVHATAPGLVTFAGWFGGYGLCIAVDHGGGVTTLFGHLSSADAQAGDNVGSGQVIGRVGSTGQSTGPHLHYEVRLDGRPVNPRGYL